MQEMISLDDIIREEKVTTLYQPIVNLKSGEIIGYEALSRGPELTSFYSPLALIEAAHHENRIWELEMLFRKKALEKIGTLHNEKLLFLNVDPDVIKAPEYRSGLTKDYLESLSSDASSIVFEITERTAINDYEAFHDAMDNYRNQGYLIAIDDVGAGYSGLKTINEVRPNFIKIDMDLVRNIDKDAFKQALLKAFVDTSMTTNIRIIAEGIETKEELKTLILLGVHGGQGYYLKKPAKQFETLDHEIVTRIRDYNKISRNLSEYSSDYHYISNLVNSHEKETYETMTPCMSIKSLFDKRKMNSICICENERPVGIVMRHSINAIMSGNYGYALYANKSIERIMNKHPLIVDAYTPINVVSKSAMERCDDELYDDIIVTKASRFLGTVPMKKILEYTLMYEKNNAKESNPLTGLPGNQIIKRVISDIVEHGSKGCILYVDINEFKVYNDIYGFEKGDFMIRYLADMLTETVKTEYPYSSFIGHVGGDDFIVVLSGSHSSYYRICKTILDHFEKEKALFFSKEHLESGVIHSEDRFGVMRQLSLTSLSVSGIHGDLGLFETVEALTESLASLKKSVKKVGKSAYVLKSVVDAVEESITIAG